jgi:Fur family transcriptional regulator, ferric uptake regulator
VSLPAVAVSQSPEERFREFLASRPKPQRFTEQQREMIEYVFASKLVEAGLLRKIEVGSRTLFDHDYGYPWHEHLVCDRCEKMIEFQHPAIEEALKEIAAQHRFRAEGHTLVVRGICAECAASSAQRRRLVM